MSNKKKNQAKRKNSNATAAASSNAISSSTSNAPSVAAASTAAVTAAGMNAPNDSTQDEAGTVSAPTTPPTLSPEALAVLEMMRRQNLNESNVNANGDTNSSNRQIQRIIGHRYQEHDDNSAPKKHAFWDTQPMPHGGRSDGQHEEGPIVPNKAHDEIRAEPYTMPTGFEWSNVNLDDAHGDLQELYQLLSNNYVEDDDALFRFDYSPAFLLWALQPPGTNPDFVFGVRNAATKKLVAFISGVPATVQVYAQSVPVVEINFLCVHKKLRSKRLAPVLIKEITRRVNLTGTFQAVYTAGTVLPVPVSSTRYYHRSLNPKKLTSVGFTRLGNRMTLARMIKLYKLPETPEVHHQGPPPGGSVSGAGAAAVGIGRSLRPMEERDVDGVHALLTTYLQRFSLKILFTTEEIRHWLLPRDQVVNSYVMTNNDTDNVVTDFCSFYHLPSSILNRNDTLYAAYSFYNVATTIPLTALIKDALILAKSTGSDVFNALNLMENSTFLDELKFGMGDGNLQYYIYNWACPEMPPDQVGIVLL